MTCRSVVHVHSAITHRNIPGLVLDTNVCLDLFVFDDPGVRILHEALLAQAVAAWTDDACRAEWLRVLCYPQLDLDDVAREAAASRFDRLMRRWQPASNQHGAMSPPRQREQMVVAAE